MLKHPYHFFSQNAQPDIHGLESLQNGQLPFPHKLRIDKQVNKNANSFESIHESDSSNHDMWDLEDESEHSYSHDISEDSIKFSESESF